MRSGLLESIHTRLTRSPEEKRNCSLLKEFMYTDIKLHIIRKHVDLL